MKTAIWVNGDKAHLVDEKVARLTAKHLESLKFQVIELYEINTVVCFSPDYAN